MSARALHVGAERRLLEPPSALRIPMALAQRIGVGGVSKMLLRNVKEVAQNENGAVAQSPILAGAVGWVTCRVTLGER